MLLFYKSLKPLNQSAKKNLKEFFVFGATADDFLYHFGQIF